MEIRRLLILLLALWIMACAKQSSPSGGPRDEEPPELLAAHPSNETLNFDQSEVRLLFDEFIQLKNPAKHIIISPPLQNVSYKASRKELHISLPDTLQSNTTYKINFGESIQDLNEGNPLTNFSYVFATGPVLDSLTFSGTVVDAFSKEPATNVKVCLYPTLSDSFVFKNDPAYFATTNKQGQYEITHIREDTFYVVAFNDENNNFTYDPNFESLAFNQTAYYVDTNINNVSLNISEELKPFPKLTCENIGPGTIAVTLDRAPLPGEKLYASPIPQVFDSLAVDSALFYYDSLTDVRYSFINYRGDTFSQRCMAGEKGAFTLLQKRATANQYQLTLTAIIDTIIQAPIAIIDSADTSLAIDSVRDNILFLTSYKNTSQILFNDSSIVSKSGHYLSSFKYNTSVMKEDSELGTLTLVLKDSLHTATSKIVYLTTGQRTIKRHLAPGQNQATYTNLPTGNYKVKVVLDANHNHSWDPAIFHFRRQPEKAIAFPQQIEIKPKWDQTIELDLATE